MPSSLCRRVFANKTFCEENELAIKQFLNNKIRTADLGNKNTRSVEDLLPFAVFLQKRLTVTTSCLTKT